MAKRRRKSGRRTRRRVSGGFGMKGKDGMLKVAALAGGFFLGKSINAQVDKLLMKMNNSTATSTTTTSTATGTIATVAEVGIGGLLLLRKGGKGMTGKAMTVAGGVLAGAGIRRALASMGFMSGYQNVPVIGRHRMAGYQNVPVIGKSVIPAQLAGGSTPAQLQGFRVNGYTPTGSGVMGRIGALDGGSGVTNTGGGGYMG